jgi:hypothetical protein
MERSSYNQDTGGRVEHLHAGSILRIFITALSALKKPVVAVPSIIYLLIQAGIMLLYLNSTGSLLNSFWAFFVSGISAETLSHYPHHIILMQPVLSRLDVFFDIFIHVIFQGAIILMVYSSLRGQKPPAGKSFAQATGRYPGMVVISLISSGLVFFFINLSRYASRSLGTVPHAALLITGVILGLAVQALFLYSLPLLVLKGGGPLKAIKKSFSFASRSPAVTFLAVLLPFILTLPTVFLDIKAEMISLRLSPDFMIYNHLVGEVLQTISTYLVMAGSTVIIIKYVLNRGPAGSAEKRKE